MDSELNFQTYEEHEKERPEADLVTRFFYAIMYRRWDAVCTIAKELKEAGEPKDTCDWNTLKEKIFPGSSVTLEYCLQFNLDYLKSAKNAVYYNCLVGIFREIEELNCTTDILTYDEKRFDITNRKSALDVFWNGRQPVLDVVFLDKQTLPARQLLDHNCTMVLDEVGTGKTVCAIYGIQQLIERFPQKDLSILIVCPYNKRNDWSADILRQLGRASTVLNQNQEGKIVWQKSKRSGVPHFYICGNKSGSEEESTQQLKNSFLTCPNENPWDLVIIDECHTCFKNYKKIKANNVMLLTATPIVPAGNNVQDFSSYTDLMCNILSHEPSIPPIDPIAALDVQHPRHSEYTCSPDKLAFTCHFKEDILDGISIQREIVFMECERDAKRQEWFSQLKETYGFFGAIYADQDDNRLAQKMEEVYGEQDYTIEKNHKLSALCDLVNKSAHESFLIFCETQASVDLVYEKLCQECSKYNQKIGKLHSKAAEIDGESASRESILSILKNNVLKNNIRSGGQSILVTTGKSAGTGLNLGEFSTVVNYELPFTSNELEQRFGRIERADDLIRARNASRQQPSASTTINNNIKNKMIFLINKPVEGEYEFETNRMLYYSISKINETVKRMPIRNTVLFHPDYVKRVCETSKTILGRLYDELDEKAESAQNIKEYFKYLRACDAVRALFKPGEDLRDLEKTLKEYLTNTSKETLKNKLKSSGSSNSASDSASNNASNSASDSASDNASNSASDNASNSASDNDIKKIQEFYKNYFGENLYYKTFEPSQNLLRLLIEYILWLENTLFLQNILPKDYMFLSERIDKKADGNPTYEPDTISTEEQSDGSEEDEEDEEDEEQDGSACSSPAKAEDPRFSKASERLTNTIDHLLSALAKDAVMIAVNATRITAKKDADEANMKLAEEAAKSTTEATDDDVANLAVSSLRDHLKILREIVETEVTKKSADASCATYSGVFYFSRNQILHYDFNASIKKEDSHS